MLLINQMISSFGDTIFYLALINYVSSYPFAPLAILCITVAETIPQILQIFTGGLADFQNNRIKKYVTISGLKFVMYSLLTIIVGTSKFSLITVFIICGINLISDTLSYFAGSMLTPIYMRIIDEDITSAMGFRQAAISSVNVVSNTTGGLLLGILSVELFIGINALTFLIAFMGVLSISRSLKEVEEKINIYREHVNLRLLYSHFRESINILKKFPVVVELSTISIFSQVILSSLLPMSSLMLLKTPFYSLKPAQSIAILSVLLFLGSVIGNLFSGSYLKDFSTKRILFISQFARLFIIVGFWSENYYIVLLSSLFCAVTVGIVGPRIGKYTFTLIPENVIGTVQAGLAALNLVVSGVITMGIIALSSIVGFKFGSVALLLSVIIVFFIISHTKNLD